MIQERYRSDYDGEFVVVETKWTGGRKQQTREWIPNPIKNQHLSGRATAIGSWVDLDQFNYNILERHRGGLLGSKKLQNYGTGEIALKMRLDFTVEFSDDILSQLVDSEYAEKNVVYTSAKNCLQHPGSFYLVPYAPRLLNIVLPVYLSSFDSHREIFLLGYNKDTPCENSLWIEQIDHLIKTYSGTKFIIVGIQSNIPSQWFENFNCENMSYREWISYCDV
jgi:hypothetical protein